MPDALPLPQHMARLPADRKGRPVPWFAAFINGEFDFRIVKPGAIQRALKGDGLCWVCGLPFTRWDDRAFVIGPMCAVNRVSAEPPSHVDCATYSAVSCPFLNTPQMTRRAKRGEAATAVNPGGMMIERNPGVALVWVTHWRGGGHSVRWHPFPDGDGGTLFHIGEPKQVTWFCRGRAATREEVLDAISSGLPILAETAEADGPQAVAELAAMHERALELVPA